MKKKQERYIFNW